MNCSRNILRIAAIVALLTCSGCHDKWHYLAIVDGNTTLPAMVTDRPTARAGQPSEMLDVSNTGTQTVLVAALIHDNPAKRDDERAVTFVMVIDSPMLSTTYDITPSNGRFITNDAFRPARKPYDGAVGHVTIDRIEDGDVIANVVIRNTYGKTSEPRYSLRGTHRFRIVELPCVELYQAGVRLTP